LHERHTRFKRKLIDGKRKKKPFIPFEKDMRKTWVSILNTPAALLSTCTATHSERATESSFQSPLKKQDPQKNVQFKVHIFLWYKLVRMGGEACSSTNAGVLR
jgi:hypothetical protein